MDLFDYDRDHLLAHWPEMLEVCNPISNWTTGLELAWLAEAASTRYMIAEVGSYKGKSAKAMAWKCPGVIHCIDRFQDETLPEFEANLAQELKEGRVFVHHVESGDGAALMRSLKLEFDMVFIDASHEAEAVMRDIELWEPLLKPDGLLCGHDCHPSDPHNGIYAALLGMQVDFHQAADSIWARRLK